MNYELAKQLKDAGFPQADDPDYPYEPTLSELIDACGDRFYALWRADKIPIWYATQRPEIKGQEGNTSVEAVAKLWLALNQK